jgi:hypothetical protein
MNIDFFITRFTANLTTIESIVAHVSDEQSRWKPAPEKWSILEVVNHLYDEEREDFRARLDLLLHHPGEPWPPADPSAWPVERKYNERELNESIERWVRERKASLAWLKEQSSADWSASYQHPRGVLRAGDLLASWLAHDFLHIRQLARLQWEYLSHTAAPYETDYAGAW